MTLLEREIAVQVRPSTAATYRHEWAAIRNFLPGQTLLTAISRDAIYAFIERAQTDYSSRNVAKFLIHLRRLLSRAVEDGVITRNHALKVRVRSQPTRLPRFLTMTQRGALLAAAEQRGQDVHLLVACAVYLGLRKAELCALRWEDVDLTAKVVQVRNSDEFTTKNGKNRSISINRDLLPILQRYHSERGFVLKPGNAHQSGRRYRWDFRAMLAATIAQAGLDPKAITPHILRHTFASICAQRRTPMRKIADWMGHSTTDVTELYAHLCAYDPDIDLMCGDEGEDRSAEPQPPVLRIVK